MSEPSLPFMKSSPPTSPFMASSLAPPSSATEHYDEVDDATQSEKRKKPKALKYPQGIPRLTKLGRCTYGANTGPLPDGTDWSKLSVAIIKEQLNMRNIPTDGKKPILIERLENWKTYLPENIEVRPSQADFGHIDRFSNADGERRKWVDQTESKYASAIKKAMNEDMFIVQKMDTSTFGDDRVTFKAQGSSLYNVTIGKRTDCDCPSAAYDKTSNCKHIIYILTHVFRAPAELLPQKTLFTKELKKLIADAPKVIPSQSEIDNDPAFKDGKPKPKNGKSCPVCFKDFASDSATVCCAKCGHHMHSGCFNVYAHQVAGWGVKCVVCHASWTAM